MARQSVLDAAVREPRLQSPAEISDTARFYGDQIFRSLAASIFPDEFGTKFSPGDASLYVSQRSSSHDGGTVGNLYLYEHKIHQQFWPSSAPVTPLLVLEGGEGVGKSTLLRFYFDCYLQNCLSFAAAAGPEAARELASQSWVQELRQHVVLYANVRRCPSAESARGHLFRAFRNPLLKRFPDITTSNDYAMWQQVCAWDNPIHLDNQRNYPDRAAYRASFVRPYFENDEVFVVEALKYLSSQPRGSGRHYITVIVDDLDQLDLDVQEVLLNTVLDWVGTARIASIDADSEASRIVLWKAILPLRPETLSRLRRRLGPFPEPDVLEVHPPHQDRVLQARAEHLERQVANSGKQVEKDHYCDDGAVVYLPEFNFEVAHRLRQVVAVDVAEEPTNGGGVAGRPTTKTVVRRFCNESIRRYLSLRKRIALNQPVEREVRSKLRECPSGTPTLPSYLLLDALITGDRDHYRKQDASNDVLNIYDTTSQEPNSYTLMVGVHVLCLLRQSSFTKEELIAKLASIGYKRREMEDCLQAMHAKFLFRYGPGSGGDREIIVEQAIVDAHWELAQSPVYTDNMAIVTPVEAVFRKRMHRFANCDFFERATTTLAFLGQVRADEVAVKDWGQKSNRRPTDSSTFARNLAALDFPDFFSLVARTYYEWLVEQKSSKRHVGHVTPEQWDELMCDSCFDEVTGLTRTETSAVPAPV